MQISTVEKVYRRIDLALPQHSRYRLGASLAAGAIAIPLEPIPGIDLAYDVAVPIALIWYWFTFFRGAYRTMSHIPSQRAVTYRQSK